MQTLDFASMGLKELQQRARVKADLAKQSKTWIAAARVLEICKQAGCEIAEI